MRSHVQLGGTMVKSGPRNLEKRRYASFQLVGTGPVDLVDLCFFSNFLYLRLLGQRSEDRGHLAQFGSE